MYGRQVDESIYALIPPKQTQVDKPPMYKSKFAPQKMETKAYGVMGRHVGAPDPQQFMKAGEKTKGVIPQPQAFSRQTETDSGRKDAVPRASDRPIYGLKTSKNYVTANAVENILQAPKRLPVTEVSYTSKEDYGKTPEYLKRIKQERKEEDDFIKHIQQVRAEQSGVKTLPEEERLEILGALKKKWTDLNQQYMQKTPCVINTERARLRKENLEAQLTQVEKDIEKMSKKNIVVQEQQMYRY
jgi:hypothetical protein